MKTCKYCMSEIDENAIICPHCQKRQKKPKWSLFIIVILLFIFVLLIIQNMLSLNTKNEDALFKIKSDASNFESNALNEVKSKILDNEDYTESCYKINDDIYTGSIKIWLEENNFHEKIWLSNGKLFLTGSNLNDFKVIESNQVASTNCKD